MNLYGLGETVNYQLPGMIATHGIVVAIEWRSDGGQLLRVHTEGTTIKRDVPSECVLQPGAVAATIAQFVQTTRAYAPPTQQLGRGLRRRDKVRYYREVTTPDGNVTQVPFTTFMGRALVAYPNRATIHRRAQRAEASLRLALATLDRERKYRRDAESLLVAVDRRMSRTADELQAAAAWRDAYHAAMAGSLLNRVLRAVRGRRAIYPLPWGSPGRGGATTKARAAYGHPGVPPNAD